MRWETETETKLGMPLKWENNDNVGNYVKPPEEKKVHNEKSVYSK